MADAHRPAITPTDCPPCNWLPRGARRAQGLLPSFRQMTGAVTPIPDTGRVFQIMRDGALFWDRKAQGGAPKASRPKQMLRDSLWPDRNLGPANRSSTMIEAP